MGLNGGQALQLLQLFFLVTRVQLGTTVELIDYVPRLSSAALAGKLTRSTFTLEQPLGQFNRTRILDADPIWLVVAYSHAIQSFAVPQKVEDTPAPASFPPSGYYFTMKANRAHYQGSQSGSQLRVLRVGNDTTCSPNSQGCNSPLPDSGPYRVKFLVMNANGPVAETEWSEDIHLQQAREFRDVPGSLSEGTVVIIAFLSVLMAIFLAVLLVLFKHTCSRSTSISSPGEPVRMKRYSVHHMGSALAVRGS